MRLRFEIRHLRIIRLARSRIYGTCAQTFNKTGNVCIIYHQGAFVQPLLQWKINKYYIFWVCVCSLWYPAWNAHAPLLYCHMWWPVRLYNNFPHYLIKWHDFRKKNLPSIKCVLFSPKLLFETFLILKIIQRDTINVYWFSCEVPVILVRLKWNLNFLEIFAKNTQISNFMKILRVKAELLHANRPEGQTDKTKLRVAFSSSANTPT